jgi:ribosomal protein L9
VCSVNFFQELEASQEAALAQVRAESQKQVEELEASKVELSDRLSSLTSELGAVQEKAAHDKAELEKQLRVAQVGGL